MRLLLNSHTYANSLLFVWRFQHHPQERFYRYYLGIAIPKKSYRNYGFNVEVNVKFKIKSLFSKEKEVYYAWIDSFLDELSSYIGKDDFFVRIDWDSVYTMLRCIIMRTSLHHSQRRQRSPRNKGKQATSQRKIYSQSAYKSFVQAVVKNISNHNHRLSRWFAHAL